MGDTWIIDMTHYADIRDPVKKVPMPARQIGEFFGLIVSAASAWPYPGVLMPSTVACRRHPSHKACPGHIDILRAENDGDIRWHCSACDDNGLIHNWTGTPWDLSDPARDEEDPDVARTVLLGTEEYGALRTVLGLDAVAERVVMGATTYEDKVAVCGPPEDLVHLVEQVGPVVQRETDRAVGASLTDVCRRIREAALLPEQ